MPIKDTLSKAGKYAGAVSAVGAALKAASEVAPKVVDIWKDHKESKKDYIKIPNIYGSDHRTSLEKVKSILIKSGFEVDEHEAKANKRYRDCKPFDVVSSNPKPGKATAPGTLVVIKYVTVETIEESRILYENDLARKANNKQKRKEKIEKVQNTIKKVADRKS